MWSPYKKKRGVRNFLCFAFHVEDLVITRKGVMRNVSRMKEVMALTLARRMKKKKKRHISVSYGPWTAV